MARTGDLVLGDTVPPEIDEVIATGPEFFRPDMFLRAATSAGATDTLHSLLPPMSSPATETNVVSVCTSNISTLVLSAHTLAGSTTSPMLTTARTSFDGCDAGTEVDSPAFNCTVVALPIREPSAPKKLTCTWHGARWVPFAVASTLEIMARAP